MADEDALSLTEVFSEAEAGPAGVSATSGATNVSGSVTEATEAAFDFETRDRDTARRDDRHHGASSAAPLEAPTTVALASTEAQLCHQVARLQNRMDARDGRARSRSPRTPSAEEARLSTLESKQRALESSFRTLQEHWDSYKSVAEGRDGVRAVWLNSLSLQLQSLQASVTSLQADMTG